MGKESGSTYKQLKGHLGAIKKDLNRTCYLENKFKEGDKWHNALKNILLVYSLYRPDIGYTQGMHLVASLIYETI